MIKKIVTIHDIARELGITASTVSRALNDHPRISQKTKVLVLKTAKRLNYQPNTVASNLRRGKCNTIGVIIPRINRNFIANTIAGIEEITNPAGYNLLICQSNESFKKEVENIQTLVNNRVDGIILSISLETKTSSHLKIIEENNISLVQFDRVREDLNVNTVNNDNFEGSYKLVKHLIEQGYRRIAHLAGPQHINIYKQRFEGYKKALTDSNLSINKEFIIEEAATKEKGIEITKFLFGKKNKPDAVFAAGDYSALGALEVISELGIKIPYEAGVAGFANEPFTELIHPSLTTLDQFGTDMGRSAARLMLDILLQENEKDKSQSLLIKTKLIIRESTLRIKS